MSGRNKLSLLAVLSILFSLNAFAAQISVSIAPKDKAIEVLQLYPDEVGELEIIVSNEGNEAIENLNLKISVEGSLQLLTDRTATKILNQSIPLIEPGESKLIFVKVKPRELSQEKQFVYVSYGFETFTHIIATYVEIIESPLEVQARLAKSALDIGESSKLVVTIKNKSNVAVNNITAELVLPSGLSKKSPKLETDFLSPGESIADREFLFDVDPTVTGEKKLLLLVSFDDSTGRHILERDFFIDVQNRRAVLYFIVVAIVALIVIALYLKRKPIKDKKPLEQPELKELEGKEVKELPTKGQEVRK